MKAVVTGGAGFIGSHTVELLVKKGLEVIVVDDLIRGSPNNLASVIRSITFVKEDVRNRDFLEKIFKEVDLVFHLAALTSVPISLKDPIETMDVNVAGTLNVLSAARANDVKKVVLASSAAVYGNKEGNVDEMISCDPVSPYGVSKVANEIYAKMFCELYRLNTVCLRYFNVYGPRQDPNSEYAAVVPKFILKLLNNENPVIYGDGEQTRDFVYVEDVAEANMLAAEKEITGVFNVASGTKTSVNELFWLMKKIMKKEINPLYAQKREGEVRHSLADISKAKQSFGFEPKHSLENGLRKTIEYFHSMKAFKILQ